MKALVLYRSYHGNTRDVAEALAVEMTKLGLQAEVRDLRPPLPGLQDIDCVLIGAPTRMARVTWKARRALRRLRRIGLGAKPLAIFDTYGPLPADPAKLEEDRKWFYPGAAGRMQELAQKLGLNVFAKTLRCLVQGAKGPLQEGELEKAAQFAREFVAAAEKK
ncbi:MAG TPA: flavodoxin domain-containing protein [Patescibacteria group bacterium]|nr:flavodoxin domain-containing protein [Patescibacteria group bacterium]